MVLTENFSQRKNSILADIQAASNDRSPKGSIDERVCPFLDLLNSHPDYVTTSRYTHNIYTESIPFLLFYSLHDDSPVPVFLSSFLIFSVVLAELHWFGWRIGIARIPPIQHHQRVPQERRKAVNGSSSHTTPSPNLLGPPSSQTTYTPSSAPFAHHPPLNYPIPRTPLPLPRYGLRVP
jgi:hypothetical protein